MKSLLEKHIIVAIFTAVIVGLTAVSIAKVNQAAFSGYDNGRIILQAQQYAEAEAAVVKATAYEDLVAHRRADIKNSDDYEAEVTLSAEFDYTDSLTDFSLSLQGVPVRESCSNHI